MTLGALLSSPASTDADIAAAIQAATPKERQDQIACWRKYEKKAGCSREFVEMVRRNLRLLEG